MGFMDMRFSTFCWHYLLKSLLFLPVSALFDCKSCSNQFFFFIFAANFGSILLAHSING